MRYLLDTNIVLHIIRNSSTWQKIKDDYKLYKADKTIYISIITYAEIISIAKQLNWGQTKLEILQRILITMPTLMLNRKIAEEYVNIDVYSQGKSIKNPLPYGMSARNMGKNDLWIAATTKHIGAQLITTDKDFDHLNNVFFKLIQIDQ